MGVAVDLKKNKWIETSNLSDEELDEALYHGEGMPLWGLVVIVMVLLFLIQLF